MIRSLLLCSLFLAFGSTSASGGLDITWNTCNIDGGQLFQTLDCAGGTPATLYGSWQVPVAQDSVVSLDGDIELMTFEHPMPSFWHFESCNPNYDFTRTRPASGCGGSFETWATDDADQGITYLPPGSPSLPPGDNRGKFVFTIFRPSGSPIDVPAQRNNFGFALTFLMDAAAEGSSGGTCLGCTTETLFHWRSGRVGNVRATDEGHSFEIFGAGIVADCATANGFTLACVLDPVQNRTWGQIKSLYR